MPMSSGLQDIMEAATTLARELEHNQVQPLHLVAAILAEETTEPARDSEGSRSIETSYHSGTRKLVEAIRRISAQNHASSMF